MQSRLQTSVSQLQLENSVAEEGKSMKINNRKASELNLRKSEGREWPTGKRSTDTLCAPTS